MQQTQEQLLIYSALLTATTSLATGSTPHEVLRAACDALVSSSNHVCLAWMYLGNPDTEDITPSYAVGPAADYARNLVLDRSPEAMKGPGRRSLAANEPVLVQVHSDATFGIWRQEAERYGFEEGLTLPIGNPGDPSRGLIVIFADAPDYFGKVGVEPFIAFAQLAAVALNQANLKISLEQMATVDLTSNLLNRRALAKISEREYAQAKRSNTPLSFLLVDLDRFKLLNDNYGHALGDQMLSNVAAILKASLRSCDWVGRWGGEEFLAILPDTDAIEALNIAERLRAEVERSSIPFNGQTIRATASIGVASFPRDGATPDFLLRAADVALYEAKKTGRNRVTAAGEKHEVYSIASKIGTAIEAQRIVPAYQSIVDLQTREVVAEESLARLIDDTGAPLDAIHFITAATELQLTHLIDFQIIKQTINRCAANLSQGARRIAHFVNVSGDLLLHQDLIESLFTEAQAVCVTCGVDLGPTKPMVLEITERQLLGDMAAVRAKLAPFLDFGMRLAVDDFGSGYSSFQYLAELPISFLKIEGTLIKQVREKRIRQIIQRINDIAKDLDLITIAEFIEDAETADILCDLGIDWGQGYFFGRPKI
jgi:diguanylate cyclase (GGDEF)-like protein